MSDNIQTSRQNNDHMSVVYEHSLIAETKMD